METSRPSDQIALLRVVVQRERSNIGGAWPKVLAVELLVDRNPLVLRQIVLIVQILMGVSALRVANRRSGRQRGTCPGVAQRHGVRRVIDFTGIPSAIRNIQSEHCECK